MFLCGCLHLPVFVLMSVNACVCLWLSAIACVCVVFVLCLFVLDDV